MKLIMTHKNVVLLVFILMTFVWAKVSITDLSYNFSPQNQQDYSNFINLFLGQHLQSSTLSPALAKIAADNRPSLMNSVSQVVLLLVPTSNSQHAQNNNPVTLTGRILQKLISKNLQKVVIKMIDSHDESSIKSYQKENALVNIISGDVKQLQALAKALSLSSSQNSQTSRRLQSSSDSSNNGTYLIKFFFSLLFVFVIIGIISFIAGNYGKKDTLLYAKFIADVGNSR